MPDMRAPIAPIHEDQLSMFEWIPAPMWAYCCDERKMLWSNARGLEFWKSPSLEEFTSRDFSADSDTAKARQDQLARRVKGGEFVVEHWTLYPRGVAVQVIVTIVPLLKKNGNIALLLFGQSPDPGLTDPFMLRGVEALRHTQVKIVMFNDQFDTLMINPAAERAFTNNKLTPAYFTEEDVVQRFQSQVSEASALTSNLPPSAGKVNQTVTKDGELEPEELKTQGSVGAGQKREEAKAQKTNRSDSPHRLDGVIFEGEYRMVCGTEPHWHSVAVRRCLDPCTGKVAFLLQAVDIDDRVEAQRGASKLRETLHHSEQNFRLLYEDATDAIMLVDTRLKVLDANASAQALLGFEKSSDLIGMTWSSLSHPSSLQCLPVESGSLESCAEELVAGMESVNCRYEWSLINGRGSQKDPIKCEVSVSRLKRTYNSKDVLLVIVRDITKQKQLEEQQIQARAEAERLLTVKAQFLAAMSHELRTPLTGIIGSLEIIEQEQHSPHTSEFLQIMRESTQLMQDIVNNILDLSKLEAGKMTISPTAMDLGKAIDDSVSIVRPLATKKGLKLTTIWHGPKDTMYMADDTRIRQVLLNLLGNAVKFTEEGGVVIQVNVCASQDVGKRSVSIAIEDTGTGIPEEFLPQLFNHFTQADSSMSRRFDGSGLGLAITRRLLDLLGGSISVETRVGKGTTFKVRLELQALDRTGIPEQPSAKANLNHCGTEENRRAAPNRTLDVLMAEDNKINQAVIRSLLLQLGHKVTIVENGLEAIEAVCNHDYDVVLMDWMMPGCDGLEATKTIRRLGKVMPIIAITANLMPGDDKLCRDSGMNAVVTKPIKRDDLKNVLCTL